jgi:hypothetical protein
MSNDTIVIHTLDDIDAAVDLIAEQTYFLAGIQYEYMQEITGSINPLRVSIYCGVSHIASDRFTCQALNEDEGYFVADDAETVSLRGTFIGWTDDVNVVKRALKREFKVAVEAIRTQNFPVNVSYDGWTGCYVIAYNIKDRKSNE